MNNIRQGKYCIKHETLFLVCYYIHLRKEVVVEIQAFHFIQNGDDTLSTDNVCQVKCSLQFLEQVKFLLFIFGHFLLSITIVVFVKY